MPITLGNGTILGLNVGGFPAGSIIGSNFIDESIAFEKLLSTNWTFVHGTTGSQKLPNGVIIKWGPGLSTTAGTANWKSGTITFGTAFPNSCLLVVTGLNISADGVTFGRSAVCGADSWNVSNFRSLIRKITSDSALMSSYYLAIGS